MSLQYFQEKIKEKRKKTLFRDFLMEIMSWESFNFYKNKGLISSYPPSERIKNGRNIMFLGGENQNENMYDFGDGGTVRNSDIYGVNGAGGGSQNIYLSKGVIRSSNIYYSFNLDSCSFCLGCINLQNQSYCIFNKQYEKEDWYKKVEEIFSSMEKDGTLGDYFPASMNPYYFNDSLAYMMMDFSKEEIIKAGFLWRDEEIKVDIPENADIIQSKELSSYQSFDANGSWTIHPDIMKKIIQDEEGNYYRITKQEYDFLIKYALPVPDIHWFERMKINFGF